MKTRIGFGVCCLFLLTTVAIFAPSLAPFAIDDIDISMRLIGPSDKHFFGSDYFGADVLTSIIWGARTIVVICFSTVLITMIMGVVLGLIAGYIGGVIDFTIMRITDLLMAFPTILLAMALTALMGPSTFNVIFAISFTGWTSYARLVRSGVLSVREQDFILAAQALGFSNLRIMLRYLLPNISAPVIVMATFNLSGVILIEASLSFLGLSSQSGAASWGALLSQGRTVLVEAPHLSLIPGFFIMILVLSLNFMGDALRDYIDPKKMSL